MEQCATFGFLGTAAYGIGPNEGSMRTVFSLWGEYLFQVHHQHYTCCGKIFSLPQIAKRSEEGSSYLVRRFLWFI